LKGVPITPAVDRDDANQSCFFGNTGAFSHTAQGTGTFALAHHVQHGVAFAGIDGRERGPSPITRFYRK
jgi:hypothetical protein